MPRRLRRDEYTVGWICALPVELAVAQEMLDEEHDYLEHYENDESLYSLGSIRGHSVVIVCLPAGRIGNNPAAAVATQMRATFKGIRFVLMFGIGGGVPSTEVDIRLGDVVVSQPDRISGGVVQYDLGKATPGGFDRTGSLNSPPQILLGAVAKVQANELRGRSRLSEYFSQLSRMSKFQRSNAGPDILFEAAYDHEGGQTCGLCKREKEVDRQRRESEEVVVHYGAIASGNQVIRDGRTRDRVSRELGGVLCFEMEAAGLMNNFPCLAIRGICDYADSHKNKMWQAFAAAVAAAYAKELLSVIPSAEIKKSCTTDEIIKEMDAPHSILNQLSYAENAPLNSNARQYDPTCLPDSRVPSSPTIETVSTLSDMEKDRLSESDPILPGSQSSTIPVVDLNSQLFEAVRRGRAEKVRLLLDKGADLEARTAIDQLTPLHTAALSGHLSVVKLLLSRNAKTETQDKFGRRPIDCAGLNGLASVTMAVLDRQVELCSASRATLLHYAAYKGDIPTIYRLLSRGYDPNALDDSDATPLHYAVQNLQEAAAVVLLGAGADASIQSINWGMALHQASYWGLEMVVEIILNRGIDVNRVKDLGNWTALHLAALAGHETIVLMLIGAGANISLRNNSGQTPEDLAINAGHHGVVMILRGGR